MFFQAFQQVCERTLLRAVGERIRKPFGSVFRHLNAAWR